MASLTGTALGYRHGNYPVRLGSATLLRAQYADVTHNFPLIPVSELGTITLVGLVADPTTAAGTFTVLVRGNQLAAACGVNAAAWQNATSTFTVARGPGVDNAQLSVVTLSTRVGDFASMNVNVVGIPETFPVVVAPAVPSAPIAFRSPDVVVASGGFLNRVQGAVASCTINRTPLFQEGSGSVLGYAPDPAITRLDIDVVESTNTSLPISTLADPDDFTITVGLTNLIATVHDGVLMMATYAGVVNGWATRRFTYMSLGSDATGGFSLAAS